MTPSFHPLRVRSVRGETDDAVVVFFDVPDALREAFRFEPGQHLTLRHDIDGVDLRRSYSICTSPEEGELCIGVRKVQGGVFSSWLHGTLRAGHMLQVMPPQGRFCPPVADRPVARHVLGIAAGSGITPILSILKSELGRFADSRCTLLYGNRSLASTMFREDIEDLKNRHLHRLAVHHVFSREATDSPLHHGRLDRERLQRFLSGPIDVQRIDHAFVCGPFGLDEAAESALREAGMPPERIHLERFGVPNGAPLPPAAPHEPEPAVARIALGREGVERTFDMQQGDPSILDAAVRAGMDVPYSCKSGVCATCRVKVLSGRVHMSRNFALDATELAAGFVLSCQSHALTDTVTVSFDER